MECLICERWIFQVVVLSLSLSLSEPLSWINVSHNKTSITLFCLLNYFEDFDGHNIVDFLDILTFVYLAAVTSQWGTSMDREGIKAKIERPS